MITIIAAMNEAMREADCVDIRICLDLSLIAARQSLFETPRQLKILAKAGVVDSGALGFIFLMHTRFDWQFYWIEEWWPLGFMLLGGYLIYKARRNGRKEA